MTPAGLCRDGDAAAPQKQGPPHAGLAAELPGRRGSASASAVVGHSYRAAGGMQRLCDSLPSTAPAPSVCMPSQLCQKQEAMCFLKTAFTGSAYCVHCCNSPAWDGETPGAKGSFEDLCLNNTDPSLARPLRLLNALLGFGGTWVRSVCVPTCKCFFLLKQRNERAAQPPLHAFQAV